MATKYNYEKLMSYEPFVFATITKNGQTIDLVEHPLEGDGAPIIAVCHEIKKAECTGFFETNDMMDENGDYYPSFVNGVLYIGEFICNDSLSI